MNFLVLIYNAATAEAMSFARKSGLDLTLVQSLVDDSFASSKIWGLRGKMMVERDYVTSRGTYGIARKDAQVIEEFARSNGVPTPLFQAALQMHLAGISHGYGDNGTRLRYSKFVGSTGSPVETADGSSTLTLQPTLLRPDHQSGQAFRQPMIPDDFDQQTKRLTQT